jgi:hypothetical protein
MKKLTELEDHDKDAAIEPPRRKPFPQMLKKARPHLSK